ncbi:similar to Saccharomyces cerevisiae YML064C TEM1 GTP-binding protein of the ras superfamily involved in termination of M-phase [Maudiozyma barnettii]|uniref:Similar to Saccharomyces cerevisiae YML064C TEM1 GTP-binding protein of the ras superfamily involved in termination of M-phase n=1 Tax=Maudiozyma barnettii TaxID=61262 RepID=A0A8H2ZJG7_9SACH|nr:uncharacterized protein KABA2_10S00924 [Kazachstania barnettii]CAB4256517.1 similar to Saccharomyces cerevisiae YML064C TEM1 GTP-binding protein of the ras superfamily involved in termination of M-phase [Kazachstania barnettii]CAD1785120.1 similar to Saccharomyces cerevisiae YML064C TEM1 GTP-binding protein of the ras superfamily involved in termination of M-phase [Kazachstania barnettii]
MSSDKNKVNPREEIQLQIGIIGDAQVGKTSLMVKYVQDIYNKEYTQTLGVNFLKKRIRLRSTDITLSLMDLGGQREFINMLPLATMDSYCILLLFDLTRPETLKSVREWYRQAFGLNKNAIPILVGTKYDLFIELDQDYQEEISRTCLKYAQIMDSPVIFSSSAYSINIQILFKIIIAKIFNLRLTISEISDIGDPLLIYKEFGNTHLNGS